MADTVILTASMEGENGQLASFALETRDMVHTVAAATGINPGMVMSAVLSGLCAVADEHGPTHREGWAKILEAWVVTLRSGQPIAEPVDDAIGNTVGNA